MATTAASAGERGGSVPNARYLKGRRFEQWIVAKLRAAGWEAHRFAGSKGAWDVHAWRAPSFIETRVSSADDRRFTQSIIHEPLAHHARYIQASAGPGKDARTRAALALAPLPAGAVGEIWRKREGGAVEVIRWDGDVWASVEEWWL